MATATQNKFREKRFVSSTNGLLSERGGGGGEEVNKGKRKTYVVTLAQPTNDLLDLQRARLPLRSRLLNLLGLAHPKLELHVLRNGRRGGLGTRGVASFGTELGPGFAGRDTVGDGLLGEDAFDSAGDLKRGRRERGKGKTRKGLGVSLLVRSEDVDDVTKSKSSDDQALSLSPPQPFLPSSNTPASATRSGIFRPKPRLALIIAQRESER